MDVDHERRRVDDPLEERGRQEEVHAREVRPLEPERGEGERRRRDPQRQVKTPAAGARHHLSPDEPGGAGLSGEHEARVSTPRASSGCYVPTPVE